MRVVFKIVTGPRTNATSGSARYITDRDRNPKLEDPSTRSLFTPHDDQIKWNAANSYLSGKPTARPRTADLHHLVLSFDAEDAKDLERFDSSDRDKPYRLITRQAMSKIAERLSVSNVKWVAGVHRHTAHPHIHLILHKNASDPSTGDPKRITRFPREMLNDRDEKGAPVAGIVNLEFSGAIDGLLRRERKPDGTARDGGTAQFPGGGERPTAQNTGSHDEVQKVDSAPKPSPSSDQRDNSEPQTTDAARAPDSSPSEASERPVPGDPPARTGLLPNLIELMMLQEPQEPHRPEIPDQQPHPANLTQPPLPAAPAAHNLGNADITTDHFLGNEQPDAAQPAEFSDEKSQSETRTPEGDADFISPTPNPFISPTPEEVSARDQASQQQPPDLDDSFDLDF